VGAVLSHVRLDDLPVEDRFDVWWEAVAQSVVPVEVVSENRGGFWGEMTSLDLGTVQLSRVRCASFEAQRTPRLIRRSDPDLYQLSLTLRGCSGFQQEGREVSLGPSDLIVYDTSRAFRAWTVADPPVVEDGPGEPPTDPAEGLILQLPRELLPMRADEVSRLLAVRLSGGDGVGGVLNAVLRQLITRPPAMTPETAARLSATVLDLIAALLAEESGTPPPPSHDERQDALLLRVQSFVERNLGEPALAPADIAAAHHISVRYLHKLFQRHALTVAGWIRRRRLERCRRDLANPLLAHQTVQVIAGRWGFTSDSHFNRLFREAYDVTPAAYRRSLAAGSPECAERQ
jgi:AraC-like DNA-binding protein